MLGVVVPNPIEPFAAPRVFGDMGHIKPVRFVIGVKSGKMGLKMNLTQSPGTPSTLLQGAHKGGQRRIQLITVFPRRHGLGS